MLPSLFVQKKAMSSFASSAREEQKRCTLDALRRGRYTKGVEKWCDFTQSSVAKRSGVVRRFYERFIGKDEASSPTLLKSVNEKVLHTWACLIETMCFSRVRSERAIRPVVHWCVISPVLLNPLLCVWSMTRFDELFPRYDEEMRGLNRKGVKSRL